MKIFSYAKVNIFLKIIGFRNSYHEIISRFTIVKNLFDTITFEKKEFENDKFELIGKFGCDMQKNTIYKAFEALAKNMENPNIKEFFKKHKVVVNKNIPEFAGLGGGSSNAASFMRLTNDILKLGLSQKELANIGSFIGADVPFFIHGFNNANVSGIGEKVEEFEENTLDFYTITPDIKCDTKKVYEEFRKNAKEEKDIFSKNINLANKLKKMKSEDILKKYEAKELNDLFTPALTLYPSLKNYCKNDLFFSGSGSALFKVLDR